MRRKAASVVRVCPFARWTGFPYSPTNEGPTPVPSALWQEAHPFCVNSASPAAAEAAGAVAAVVAAVVAAFVAAAVAAVVASVVGAVVGTVVSPAVGA